MVSFSLVLVSALILLWFGVALVRVWFGLAWFCVVYFEFGFVWFGLGLVGRSDVAGRRMNGQTDTRADGTVGRADQTSGKRTDERRGGPDNSTNGRSYFFLE